MARIHGFGKHVLLSKKLDDIFYRTRELNESYSYVALKKRHGAVGQGIELFLGEDDLENSLPPCDIERIRKFCPISGLTDLEKCRPNVSTRQGAWLDDRALPDNLGRHVREYETPLTAQKLLELLKVQAS